MYPQFYKPANPFTVIQPWGALHPEYPFGFHHHNGIDVALGTARIIYAPFDGTLYRIGNQPNGGGIFCGLLSDNFYDFSDMITCQVLFDFLHCERIIAEAGKPYKVGDILAIGDSTGYSTGNHTHIQCRRVKYDGQAITTLDTNDMNNSFDPTPYMSGFANEHGSFSSQLQTLKLIVLDYLNKINPTK